MSSMFSHEEIDALLDLRRNLKAQVERLTQERDAAIAELNLWKADDSPSMVWQLRSTQQQVRELREALGMVWRMEGPNGNTYPAWVVEIADAALAAAKEPE